MRIIKRPLNEPSNFELLLHQAKMSKGGAVGTNGKGAIALRFDDGQDAMKATIAPLLYARGLPFSLVTISRGPGSAAWWGAGTTWADIHTMRQKGGEMWSHGYDHTDYLPSLGLEACYTREIVDSKAALEAQGFKVQGWALPGITQLGDTLPFPPNGLTSLTGYQGYVGQLLMNNYALIESDWQGTYRTLPSAGTVGLSHLTISDGISLAQATAFVDSLIREKLGGEVMIHPHNIGQVGKLSLADFTTWLDYIVTKYEAGLLDILTPSSLNFADKNVATRTDLYSGVDGTFETITTGDTRWSNWGTKTIETGGGYAGDKFLRIPAADATILTQTYRHELAVRGLSGETFMFEGWARCPSGTSTTSRFLVQDYDNTARLNQSFAKLITPAQGWVRHRYCFTTHKDTNRITLGLARNGGDGVDWDNITIRQV